MAVSGDVNPHLPDDLSERIYAAYYALLGNGIRNARGRIAKVLNAKKLHTKPQDERKPWDGDHVIERVRRYEKRSLPSDKGNRAATTVLTSIVEREYVSTQRLCGHATVVRGPAQTGGAAGPSRRTFQGSSSAMRLIGWSAMRSSTWRR